MGNHKRREKRPRRPRPRVVQPFASIDRSVAADRFIIDDPHAPTFQGDEDPIYFTVDPAPSGLVQLFGTEFYAAMDAARERIAHDTYRGAPDVAVVSPRVFADLAAVLSPPTHPQARCIPSDDRVDALSYSMGALLRAGVEPMRSPGPIVPPRCGSCNGWHFPDRSCADAQL